MKELTFNLPKDVEALVSLLAELENWQVRFSLYQDDCKKIVTVKIG